MADGETGKVKDSFLARRKALLRKLEEMEQKDAQMAADARRILFRKRKETE